MLKNFIRLILLTSVLSACGGTTLYSALSERQANEVVAALLISGIDARKEASVDGKSWMVITPLKQMPKAMMVLEEKGLPRTAKLSMGDVFKKEGFVSSPTEERARFLYAISQELTQTLMEIDGVITARVHVALPEKALLSENQGSASVSVVVIQSPNANLSNYETDIKAIITDGVEGLDDVNKVTVKFFTRNESFNYIPAENGDLSGQGTFTLQASVFGFVLGTGFILAFGYFRRRRQPDAAVPELKPEL